MIQFEVNDWNLITKMGFIKLGKVFCLSAVLWSCTSGVSENAKPEGIIDQQTMTDIIYDLSLIEAAWRSRLYADTLAQTKASQRILFTFKKYGVTQAKFDSSYSYYLEQPIQLEEIYGEVLNRYSTRLSEIEEEVE
jgi:hypothetical protein